MSRKLVALFICFFLVCTISYGVDVDVKTYVYKDFTSFNYIFQFDANSSTKKFSVEKPKDATLNYIVDKNGPIEYSVAGDYYIFKPENAQENTFLLRYESKEISKNIFETDSFRTYIGFDFIVENLSFELVLKDDFGDINDIFPAYYILFPDRRIKWNMENSTKESLFIVDFKDVSQASNDKSGIDYTFLLIIFIPTIVILVGFVLLYKNYANLTNKITKEKNHIQNDVDEADIVSNKNTQVGDIQKIAPETKKIKSPEELKEEKFIEIVEKHLTENEKIVVILIKENEGLSQQDILNHLPQLSKSNLSKIISKLHSKRILKRIKVGKISKIYLGEKVIDGDTPADKYDKLEE